MIKYYLSPNNAAADLVEPFVRVDAFLFAPARAFLRVRIISVFLVLDAIVSSTC